MLFQKIWIESTPDSNGQPVESWQMVLRTIEDVQQYANIEAELMGAALLALPDSYHKSHLDGGRETLLFHTLQNKQSTVKEGEKIYPVLEAAKLVDNKTLRMLGAVLEGKYIRVNQKGGYCFYEDFMNTWDAKVLTEIEQEGCYFPTDNQPIETDVLFLENGERVPVDFERKIDKLVGVNFDWNYLNTGGRHETEDRIKNKNKTKYKLQSLKLRDPKFVFGMLAKSKVIAVQTQLADSGQLDKFMDIFSKLERKIIYLDTPYVDQLKAHPLYEICAKNHNIIFVK